MVAISAGTVRADPQAEQLAALRVYADGLATMGESPSAFAHHLSYLQLDLTDPDLHKHVRAQASASRDAIRAILEDAIAARELKDDVDSQQLARSVEVALSGSLMTWAFYQDGNARSWMRADLDNVLRPYLTTSTGARRVTRIRKRK